MAAMVLRYRDGKTARHEGECSVDLDSQSVSLTTTEGDQEVGFSDLKAIFFLRGTAAVEENQPTPDGSVLAVEFEDGEIIRGTAKGYRPGDPGFMLHPFDRSSQEKIFVVASAVLSIDVEKL